ncbi:DUF4376 domain-containing protein, partial [Desulfosarcina sp. OttesenSCG-928-B08]|nr:DUF4376 domain-containing protein [Desulfosarcina sp. OttesenSCG-928-B08]
IYRYTQSGEYRGSAQHDASQPLPADALSIPPPALDGPQAAVINATRDGWDVVEDYRNWEVVDADGNPATVTEIGPLPEGWRHIDPTAGPGLESVRAAAMEALRLRKWQAKDAGITVNGVAIDTDDRGQATLTGAATNVLLDPNFTAHWKTNATDDAGQSVWITLDATMIVGLSKALTHYTEACFAVEAAKQAELAACESVDEIQAWLAESLHAGWPGREMTL